MEIVKLILTSLTSVVAIFGIAKVIGHKQLAQLDFFDYISGITVGSIAAELATEIEKPWKPLLALVLYGAVSVVLSLVSHKFPRSRKYINGTPSILYDNGKLYRENMKKAKLDLSEFMAMCREQGYFDLTELQTVVFETNGKLSILPVSENRPVTPEDMSLQPKPAHIKTEVILDGRVLEGNLRRMGRDAKWLEKRVKEQGYPSAEAIFLGICDPDGTLTLFP